MLQKTPSYRGQNKEKLKEYLEKIENIFQKEINYIDETEIQAYTPRGEKNHDSISEKEYRRINIVATKRNYAIAENYHMILIFLLPYSSELNLTEHEWANMKRWLKYHLHGFDTFWQGLLILYKNHF